MTYSMHRLAVVAACLCAGALTPAALRAQRPRPLTLDASLGSAGGYGGGELSDRTGLLSADAIVAYALRPAPGGTWVLGAGASFQGGIGSNDMCTLGSRGQCLERFPRISTVGATVGWEGRTGRGRSVGATVRLLAGPAYAYFDGDDSAGQRGSAAGVQARLDLATPHAGPVAGVVSLRGTAVPNFRGESYRVWALGVGLRLR